ncbi:hypothetical protein ACGLHS_29870 [Variovorax sp. VaC1]|uniref:hypothetical protein n=1 Tax=Variovorax sp. VaC1 TaxID=3373132 RepID=UPI00374A20C7
MARPRIRAATAAIPAALVLLLMSGCSHYQIGIPLVPGLSLGLGATKDGSFSMGLNTGFGPLGAGVAVNNGGQVSGSAGVGVGVGPVAAGVSKGTVLYDPKAAPAAPAGGGAAAAGAVASTAPVAPAGLVPPPAAPAPVRYSTPADPFTPIAAPAAQAPAAAAPATRTVAQARAPLVKITRPPPEPVAPAVNHPPAVAAASAPVREAGALGTPGNPVAP